MSSSGWLQISGGLKEVIMINSSTFAVCQKKSRNSRQKLLHTTIEHPIRASCLLPSPSVYFISDFHFFWAAITCKQTATQTLKLSRCFLFPYSLSHLWADPFNLLSNVFHEGTHCLPYSHCPWNFINEKMNRMTLDMRWFLGRVTFFIFFIPFYLFCCKGLQCVRCTVFLNCCK